MYPSTALRNHTCNKAPASPPAALVMPKVKSTRRSRRSRMSTKRRPVATKCGTETTATASLVPIAVASSGVRMLPMPKPAMEAIPAATTAATITSALKTIVPYDVRGSTADAGRTTKDTPVAPPGFRAHQS